MNDTAFPQTLAKALVGALAQMTGVTKGRKADAGKYSYGLIRKTGESVVGDFDAPVTVWEVVP